MDSGILATYMPEGAEDPKNVIRRSQDFLNDICAREDLKDKTVLIVTHGFTLRCLLSSFYEDKDDYFHKPGVLYNCQTAIAEHDAAGQLVGSVLAPSAQNLPAAVGIGLGGLVEIVPIRLVALLPVLILVGCRVVILAARTDENRQTDHKQSHGQAPQRPHPLHRVDIHRVYISILSLFHYFRASSAD